MKRHIASLILICSFLFTLVSGCKKDQNEHPEVQTLEIEALSPSRIILKGNIVSTGEFNATDYGFYYGSSASLGDGMGTKVSMGSELKEGQFSKEVQPFSYFSNPQTIYARAYITDSNGTIYGPVNSVQIPSVSYSSVVPSSGKAGDLITLNGQFHKLTKEEITVSFAGISAQIEEVTSSKVTVKVPTGINTSNNGSNQVNITIALGGHNIYGSQNVFTINPTPKDFSPKAGTVGTSILITGDNIPSSYYYNNSLKVYFGQTQVAISNQNSSGISVSVPGNITDAKFAVSVEFNGIKTTLPGEFTITPHTITAISPASGLPGSSFSIFGNNFVTNYYSSSNLGVTIGGIPASVSIMSTGQLTATIPVSLPAGDYKVSVKQGPFTVEAPQTLKVQNLTLSSFSPSSGGVGKEVTIQGIFMPGSSHQVYFGSLSTYTSNTTATTLKVNVPFGAVPGDSKITVKYGNQSAESSSDFTVLAPSITSFSPTSGVAGTEIIISGSGFSPYTTVRFGTIQTNVIIATESTLKVVVPSNLNLGAMKITVISNGQTIVSSANFTATN
ncbi:IPT/TIG domain-containing protein [Paradesertivirga mongoliensis]|uniref:IPT/TIG domain-containing protein n=1 Tax=Paradesertivirga mongoliensis TaxID=2100740 RepID=A0ABW4ZJA0_9SPHI|nr:IPT/TIG domain-containing protein [Pedobacter mongoliensis]